MCLTFTLVNSHCDGHSVQDLASQKFGNGQIHGSHSYLTIYHQDNTRRFIDCNIRLLSNLLGKESTLIIIEYQTPSVHQLKVLTQKVGITVGTISCNTRLVRHNGTSVVSSRNTVHQGGLSNVGASNNGNQGFSFGRTITPNGFGGWLWWSISGGIGTGGYHGSYSPSINGLCVHPSWCQGGKASNGWQHQKGWEKKKKG
mmetsp:Transcript_37210/g.90383  ORF Transcript_37210/g.90383 Transcript_37210/m.90383 type:complete len:200 (+) Transcript_37210:2270-2869(+)